MGLMALMGLYMEKTTLTQIYTVDLRTYLGTKSNRNPNNKNRTEI